MPALTATAKRAVRDPIAMHNAAVCLPGAKKRYPLSLSALAIRTKGRPLKMPERRRQDVSRKRRCRTAAPQCGATSSCQVRIIRPAASPPIREPNLADGQPNLTGTAAHLAVKDKIIVCRRRR
jgi:hypothetical protein